MLESQVIPGKPPLIDRIRANVNYALFYQNLIEPSPISQIIDSIKARPFVRGEFIQAVFTLVYSSLPNKFRLKKQQDAFSNIPLDIPTFSGYRVLRKIGSGGINIVFILNGEGNMGSSAVGIRRLSFTDTKTAIEYAKCKTEEVKSLQAIYRQVPELIKNELFVPYIDNRQKLRVIYLREYFPEPLTDIFSLNENELIDLLKNNRFLYFQLSKFIEISKKNKNIVVDQQLDLLGKRNLCLVGNRGEEKLLLLDPHRRECDRDPKKCREIEARIDYLDYIVQKVQELTQDLSCDVDYSLLRQPNML